MDVYYVCPICLSMLKSSNFEKHQGKCHSDIKTKLLPKAKIVHLLTGEFHCVECNTMFKTQKAVMKHCANHVEKKKINKVITKKIKCPYCDKQITDSEINYHLKNEHIFPISYQDYLDGKEKRSLFDIETENIPSPISRINSDNVNCPICQVIIASNSYPKHFREDHRENLNDILIKNGIDISFQKEGYICPESKISGKTHKGLFVRGRFSSSKLKTKIPKFFCYTCGKTYIAEINYPNQKFISKEGTTIYNYPNLFSDEIQGKSKSVYLEPKPENKQDPKVVSDEKELGEIRLIIYDTFPKTACNYGEHDKEQIIIKTQDFHNYPIEINAFYCKKCKKFFTNYESIKKYFTQIKPYISIHCEYTEDGRRKFSELSLFGYNVEAKGLGYEEKRRRRILQDILDNNLVEKITIINLLKSFININGKLKNNQHAKECWEDDLEFVSTYVVPNTKILNPRKVQLVYKNRIIKS